MRITHSTHARAYTTLALISSISFVILTMLVYSIRGSVRNLDSQMRAQMKQDFVQKEDAILGALIHIVPNKAIGAMRRSSASTPNNFTWDAIFTEALSVANVGQSVSTQLVNSLNLGNVISSNTSDSTSIPIGTLVRAPIDTYAGGDNRVNGGNWWEYTMLGNAQIGSRVPAALQLSYDNYLLDKKYPIISREKTYTSQYSKGLGLTASDYPLYNLIQYPDVRFGYKKPGEYFVAKRNWWVFSLNFGSDNESKTGIPSVRRDYVLSIYEIPSQVPLSASTLLKVGKFADGTSWQNVSLDGSIIADRLQTEGTVTVSNGTVSARKDLTLSNSTIVDGQALQQNFDALGTRESRATASNGNNSYSDSDFYQASVGGNVGKVAFLPINRGTDTLMNDSDGVRNERISPTGWNEYSEAAPQATMTLEILRMSSTTDQTPTRIRFSYRNTSGGTSSYTYTRGSYSSTTRWPTEAQAGGSTFPFQTDTLDNTRTALIVYLDRLPAFINSLSNSGGVANNNSLYIFPTVSSSSSKVNAPSIPTAASDMVISLRGGNDLTPFSTGLSIVTRYRVYIADTLNNVPTSPPANSGLPSGYTFYPPFSIFAPEKRFGESLSISQPVVVRGQLNSLKTDDAEIVNPLELRNGADTLVDASKINADLVTLKSPAELPPIHMMNWLVTVEPLH